MPKSCPKMELVPAENPLEASAVAQLYKSTEKLKKERLGGGVRRKVYRRSQRRS